MVYLITIKNKLGKIEYLANIRSIRISKYKLNTTADFSETQILKIFQYIQIMRIVAWL